MAWRVDYLPLVAHPKRHLGDFLRFDIDTVNLAAGPEDHRGAIGHPVHIRIDAMDGPGFLHVHVQILVDRPHSSRLHVLEEQCAAGPDATYKGHIFAIRRRRRTHGAARTADHVFDLAVRQIDAPDAVDLGVRILAVLKSLAGRRVLAEIDVFAVRRKHRFAQVLLIVGFFIELHATSAAQVIEPDFPGA